MSLTTNVSLAQLIDGLLVAGFPMRFTAYDGSATGPEDSPLRLHLANERGLAYILTAPGDLGMARAYVSGDLEVEGVHPGDPYEILQLLLSRLEFRRPSVTEAVNLLRNIGVSNLVPPPPPASEHVPRWRRTLEGLRHSPARDAEVISHHYDVSNRFYEMVLGPSMTYTCALYADDDMSLEEAQWTKYELIAEKLALEPGMRLLDVGCGWGGMVRHVAKEHGVKALGVTLSANQAAWARAKIREEGLQDLVEVRHLDYREVVEDGFDAVSSIGLTEHIGVANYPAYFSFLRSRLRPGGRLLNHCITRPHNRPTSTGHFIDRYVFPDGELTGSGTIVAAAQDAGLEVQHTENIRTHYAKTLAGWSANLVDHWDECVAEAGLEVARVWGLYMAGSRIAFERDEIELHHVLATRNHHDGRSDFPLRPDWNPTPAN